MKKIKFILMFIFIFILASCNKLEEKEYQLFSMDTIINIKIYNDNDFDIHKKEIKKIYDNINNLTDDFSEDGKVYILNKNREIDYNIDLANIINLSLEIKEKTNGYFNPLIGRLSHKWKEAISNKEILDNSVIEEELNIINNSSISIDENKIKLIGDANLDLGGIAKGYATELAKKYLDSEGVKYYLINAGSSNICGTTKINKPFNLLIEKPFLERSYYDYKIKLENKSIATSSPKYQYMLKNDIKYHHLISPFTGMPINYYSSVSVIGSDNAIADALSTTFFLMKKEEIDEMINKFEGYQYLLCSDNEVLYKS